MTPEQEPDYEPAYEPDYDVEPDYDSTGENDVATPADSRSGQPDADTVPPVGSEDSNDSLWKIGLAAVVVAGAALAFFRSPVPAGSEQAFPNWDRHVVELNEQYENEGISSLKSVDPAGAVALGTSISVTDDDLDNASTDAVTAALKAKDDAALASALINAQNIPPISQEAAESDVEPVQPQLSNGMSAALLLGDSKMFHIFLYDSCDEDGDIVDVFIDGQLFATVPITHRGATLSVPVNVSGGTDVSIRGRYDGGGGITVACRTSTGDWFSRSMGIGEMQPLSIVR